MARTFNGSTQYGRNSTAAAVTGFPCTLTCWFNLAALPGSGVDYALCSVVKSSALEEFWISYQNATGTYRIRAVGQGGGVNRVRHIDTTVSTATWYHACAVFTNSSTYEIYINGSATGAATLAGSVNTTPTGLTDTYVGAFHYNTSTLYGMVNGSVAEVGMWDVALTQAEITSLASAYSPQLIRPASLKFYAPLIGQSSPEQDLRQGLSLTLTASPTAGAHPRIIMPHRRGIRRFTTAAASGLAAHPMRGGGAAANPLWGYAS